MQFLPMRLKQDSTGGLLESFYSPGKRDIRVQWCHLCPYLSQSHLSSPSVCYHFESTTHSPAFLPIIHLFQFSGCSVILLAPGCTHCSLGLAHHQSPAHFTSVNFQPSFVINLSSTSLKFSLVIPPYLRKFSHLCDHIAP